MLFCCLLICFSKSFFFSKKKLSVATRLNPDQTRRFVGPDLGPKCLQKLSADDNCRKELNKLEQITLR